MLRTATVQRKTAETDISLSLRIDGCGTSEIDTGCGFLNHMLTLFASHANFDLSLKCVGDTDVDYHHTAEDIGICLGQAFSEAIGDKKGICRYGERILPMDEALILCAIDISGRGMFCPDIKIPTEKVGDFDTELVGEFFIAFTRMAGVTLHIKQMAGLNSHHIIEGIFKAFARCLADASRFDETRKNQIPSTKGVL